jgi:acyl-CoA dehydrogenase
VLAAWLLDQAGLATPAGPLSFACTDVDLTNQLAGEPVRRAPAGRINLRLRNVPWAASCAQLVVAARHGEGVALLCLPRTAFTARRGRALSGEPRDDVSIADLDLSRAGIAWRRVATLTYVECLSRAALLRAALMAGACRRVLALTLAYTSERVQFGRAIGQFQAVQHQLAQLAEETAAARVAVHAAAATTDARWCVAASAAAKLRAGEAAGLCVRIAHQLHGAIGITIEHALQQSTRRLLTWRDEHGAEAWWARELVAQFRRHGEAGTHGVWPTLVAATTR